jgi:flagellar hook-associated protein 2
MVSPIRFSGLASGMDTETMIKDLMKAHRSPLNKLLQKKQWEEWKRDTYRDMNTQLLNFRTVTFDMRLQGTFLKKTVVSENEQALSVKNTSTPQLSTYSVKVNKLAVTGTPSSVKFTNNIADEKTKLNSAFNITIGSETIAVTADDTINSVVAKINSVASTTGVSVAYMAGDKSLTFTSTTVGAAGQISISTDNPNNPLGISNYSKVGNSINSPINTTTLNKLQFEIGGVTKTITLTSGINYDMSGPGKNLSDLAKEIQTKIDLLAQTDSAVRDADIKVNAYGDKLTFTADQAVKIVDDGTVTANNIVTAIGFSNGATFAQGPIQNGSDGQAGEVVINGTTLSISSNTFTFDGVQYTAKQVTSTAVNVNVKPDEDAVFDKIKNFVDEYNKLIDTLNKKISEPRYRDYKPLLDEEKEAMSEKQIELWEEKAKSGVLQRDPHLSKILSDMRLSLYSEVTGAGIDSNYNTLSEIGITVGDPNASLYTYQEKGKLYIDEAKLRAAIRDNGTKVMDLFTKTTTATTDPAKFNESGVAQRIYNQLNDVIDQITDVAGYVGMSDTSEYFSLGKSMKSLTKEIDRWEDRLKEIEDRYWRQFTAMEKAISQANSQSAWLTQQLGGA